MVTTQWKKRTYTENEKAAFAAKRDAQKLDFAQATQSFFTELLEEIRQGKTSRLDDYLAFVGKQYKYSPLNYVWILAQCQKRGIRPTFLRSFSAWSKSGYRIADGAKGLMISKPRPVRYTKMNRKTGEEEEGGFMDFTVDYTFDVSMLDEASQAKWHTQAKKFFDDVQAPVADVVEAMIAAIQESGIAFERKESAALGRAQGWSEQGKIVLKDGLADGNQLLTLAHEWAHEHLHWENGKVKFTPCEREQQAALVEYLFGQHFGVQSPYSRDYLLHWGASSEKLQAHFTNVYGTLTDMVQATGKKLQQKEEECTA